MPHRCRSHPDALRHPHYLWRSDINLYLLETLGLLSCELTLWESESRSLIVVFALEWLMQWLQHVTRKYLEVPGEVRRWERLSWAKNLTQTAALSHLDISVGNRNIPAMSNDFSFYGKLSRSWFEQKITGGWIHKYMNNSMFLFLTSAETRPWSWWSSSRPRSPPPGRRRPGQGRRSRWRWTDTRTRCNTRVTQSLSSLSPHLLSVSWLRARRGHCSTLKTSVDLTLSNKLAIMFDSRCSVFTV